MSNKIVEIVSENVEKKVNFLFDIEVDYVSLVKHGANRVPFRIIKTEEKEGNNCMVVQSIIIPKNVSLDDLLQEEGLEWLSEIKKEKMDETKEYIKYIQMPVDSFTDINMLKISEKGAYALVGGLKDKNLKDNLLTIGEKEIRKNIDMPKSTMNAPISVNSVGIPNIGVSFSDLFYREWDNFLAIVNGIMAQAGSSVSQKKKVVLSSLDNFKSFLSIIFDNINEEEINKSFDKIVKNKKEEVIMADIFKDREDFVNSVLDIIEKRENDMGKKVEKEKAEEVEKKQKEELAKTIEDVNKKIVSIVEDVKLIKEKQEVVSNQLVTEPAKKEPTSVIKEDPTKKDKSVFTGILN